MTLNDLILPGAWKRTLFRNAAEADSGAADGGAPAGQTQDDAADAGGKTDEGAAQDAPDASILGTKKPDAGETSESGGEEGKTEGDDAGKEGEVDPADTVPEDGVYTLELPEGMELDEALSSAAFPVFKEMGLTNAQASQLANVYADHAAKQADAAQASWQELNTNWAKSAKADKELQGEGFDKTVAIADRALDKLGTPALVEDMVKYGWGNHPEFIRFAYRAGKLIGDDSTETGGSAGADATPAEERLYGKTTPTKKG